MNLYDQFIASKQIIPQQEIVFRVWLQEKKSKTINTLSLDELEELFDEWITQR